MDKTEVEKHIFEKFQAVDQLAEEKFRTCCKKHVFGDTTFSLLYAWQNNFQYSYRIIDGCVVLLEKGLNEQISCILPEQDKSLMKKSIAEMHQLFETLDMPFYLEYVHEEMLEFYKETAQELGLDIDILTNRDDDDYIYETQKYLSLDGKENKTKRGSLNWFLRNYPDGVIKFYDGQNEQIKEDCIRVFDEWCKGHNCQQCVYGCEKQAVVRFFDIFHPQHHKLVVFYWENQPLSFAISEAISEDMCCYYFQKNIKPIRGLNYWITRELTLQCPEIAFLNLGEDMGIKGLREDKTCLHPVELKKKYTVRLSAKEKKNEEGKMV